jgi:uncharacterized protein YjcR
VVGAENPNAVLNEETALKLYNASGQYEDLAVEYGVSSSLVGAIKRGEAWAHVTGGKPSKVRGAATADDVILAIYWDPRPTPEIAEEHGVSLSFVHRIKKRESRTHLTEELADAPRNNSKTSTARALEIYCTEGTYSEISKRLKVGFEKVRDIKTGKSHVYATGHKPDAAQ